MNNSEFAKESDSGISLATVTVGIIAAAGFLLVSSFVSNDATWPANSANVWSARTLTGHDMLRAKVTAPGKHAGIQKHLANPLDASAEVAVPVQSTPQHKEAGHFYDALYSADFMSSVMEPT
jgi:hypothetical protein